MAAPITIRLMADLSDLRNAGSQIGSTLEQAALPKAFAMQWAVSRSFRR